MGDIFLNAKPEYKVSLEDFRCVPKIVSSDGDFYICSKEARELEDNDALAESLLSAGVGTTMMSAIVRSARELQVALPKDTRVDVSTENVQLNRGAGVDAYNVNALSFNITVELPTVKRETALKVIELARSYCPFVDASVQLLHASLRLR